jgi:concanavalin A-like lectin/glucanase superfamily protein
MKSTMRRTRRTLTAALGAIGLLSSGLIPQLATSAQAATCTTFFVSSSGGSDSNSGCSSSSPWQTLANVNSTTFAAGDQILFQDGGSWTGTLHPLGSGASGSPIVISNYGSGNAPIIAGGGAAEAVYLDNQQYVTIENLEITNTASSPSPRSGIEVQNDTSGILAGITIENNYIHNVLGYWSTSENVQPTNSSGIAFNLTDSFSTNGWNGVTISGNTLTNVDAGGIYLGSLNGTGHSIVTSNVVIQNNTLTNAGGNDVVCVYCNAPIVQNNVATDNGYRYSGAGFWMALNNGGVWQNNDISDQWRDLWDGEAFDIDHDNNGVILQYNYTHENPYGQMEFCCSNSFGAQNSTIRYNISQNDGVNNAVWSTLNGAKSVGSTYFYNNTVYMGPDDTGAVTNSAANGSNLFFDNNIIYAVGSGASGGYSSAGTWSHNDFYGDHPSSEPSDSNKITSDPLFVSPGGGGSTLASAAAYELQPGSPAIGAGAVMSGNGGQDYFGNPVSSTAAPNIGAYNGSGVTPSPSESGAFWPLGEGSGTVANDQTNDHNTATLASGASWTTGNTEPYALALNGSSTGYAQSGSPAINTSQSYTVSAWVKLNTTSGNNQTFASIDGSSISPFYLQLTGGKFAFTLRSSDSTGSTADVITGLAPSTGTWYQVTGVYNAGTSTASLYVNGVLRNSSAWSSVWAAGGATTIGRALWGRNKVDFTNGAIGDVRMYNKVLTSQDILALGTGAAAYFPFDEGTGTSTSNLIANTAPANFTGDAVWAGSGHSSANSVALDGTFGTSASSPAAVINTAGSYAVSVWVEFNGLPSSSNSTFVSLDGPGFGEISPFYLQVASSGKFTFVLRSSNSTSSTASTITGPSASTGTWYNVIAQYNASTDTASLYVNGASAGTVSFSSPWAGASTQFGDAVWNSTETDATNGDIDDAVFYNRVLTSTEISELAAG